jgi:hypothetical protein
LTQVEGTEHSSAFATPGAELLKDRESGFVGDDGLAVNHAGTYRQASNSGHDQWEALGEILAVAGEEPRARGVAPRQDAEAIVLDLVQPVRVGWRLLGRRW